MENDADSKIRDGIMGMLWTYYLFKLYLLSRQYRACKKIVHIPQQLETVMSNDFFERFRSYTLEKLKYWLFKDFYEFGFNIIVIYYEILPKLWYFSETICIWKQEVCVACTWMLLSKTLSTLIFLPLSLWKWIVVERQYGFYSATLFELFVNSIKKLLCWNIVCVPLLILGVSFVEYCGTWFFVYLYLIFTAVIIFIISIYPTYIVQFIEEETVLEDGKLKTDIENLSEKLNFPLETVCKVNTYARDSSSQNGVYFAGLFSKRILLYDTIIDKSNGYSDEEVLATVAHEIGHWKNNHLTKGFIINQIDMLFSLEIYANLFRYSDLYSAMGFQDVKPVCVGFFMVKNYCMILYSAISGCITNFLSRRFEFEADAFAAQVGKREALISALLRLYTQDLKYPVDDILFSLFHYEHPTLLERVRVLQFTQTS